MKNMSKHGFCWYSDTCQHGLDDGGAAQSLVSIEDRMAETVTSLVSQYNDVFKVSVSDTTSILGNFKEVLDEWPGANKDESWC